ncbi:MAG: triose-phosphate isomerase [Deltaproteobacteria bacterium]
MTIALLVGNWKMHGSRSECVDRAGKIVSGLRKTPAPVEVAIAPPYTALAWVKEVLRDSEVRLAGQNCHWEDNGAYTGEISPLMLNELGCDCVILGHSERRHIFKETDQMIAQKIVAALRNGLRPIVCVGETLQERRDGRTASVIGRQLRVALKAMPKTAIQRIEIAYEPVWAIGTGQNATPEQAGEVHTRIRKFLLKSFGAEEGNRIRILYGGSVKPENAAALMGTPEVNGLLVGGASLNPDTFIAIARSVTV